MHPLLENGLKHAETSLVALGPDGRILAIDAVGSGWLGATPEAIVGQGPWVFGGLIREAEWPATWARLEAEKHLMVEGSIVGRDGQVYGLALQLSHVPAEGARAAHVFVVAMRRHEPAGVRGSVFSRLNYASAFIDEPLIDWDVVGDELAFNDAAAARMRIPPGTSLTASAARALFPAEEAEMRPQIEALISGARDRLEILHQAQAADGGTEDCLVRFRVAARAPDGRARRVIIHVVDVTELRRAQAEARQKQELFEAVAHTSTAGIVILESTGQIVFANARAEQVLGLSRSAMVGRTYDAPEWRPTAPDGGPWPDEAQPFVRVMATGAPVHGVEHAIELPDGSRRQLSINGEPLFDGEGRIVRVLFTVDDITERHAAAERLARSEQRLRDMLDRLSIGVHLVDERGRLLLWNKTAGRMLRLERQVAGEPQIDRDDWRLVDAEGHVVTPPQYPMERALREGEAVRDVELGVVFGADPTTRWARVSAIPRLDPAGRVLDVLVQIIDVTEQRQLEQRLREARRLEAIGRLAGGVAHDFNNLLTVVLSEAEAISASLSPADPLQADLEGITTAATRGATLVRALLGYARRQFRQPRATDVARLVERVARRWRRRKGSRLDLRLVLADGLPSTMLDPDQFEQVFEALADNAWDAMPGGGRLTVQVDRLTLEAQPGSGPWPDLPPGRYLRLTMVDSGEGVPPEAVQRIFEPFFSAEARGPRPGLGLANAHGILRQNGGDIRLAHNGPDGATFEALWPVVSPTTVEPG